MIMFQLNPYFQSALLSQEVIEWDVDVLYDQQMMYLCL